MFRQMNASLPPDPEYPADLAGLGYFINDKDQIKAIKNPAQDFNYWVNKNERYNVKQREAMNTCIRKIVLDRLAALHVSALLLPNGAAPTEPHIPILASEDLSSRKRIVVVFNESAQDLGIWAYRSIGVEGYGGINAGSAVNFVKMIQSQPSSSTEEGAPGVIIANLGQLLWWRKGKQAVSYSTWDALPRESAVHESCRIDEVKNRVPGQENWAQHTAGVFEVIDKLAAKDVKLDIVGLSDGGVEIVKYLTAHWSEWYSRVVAIAFGNPLHTVQEIKDADFAEFLEKRGRAYIRSAIPAGTRVPESDSYHGCPAVSSGEVEYSECVMLAAHQEMCAFFLKVAMGKA
ncbi:MAG: hypothetical protein M4579_003165 [Chaenotheca gracillima]|nr:MAG: hypothetical protein M4579_003165 [Chaenotheca gracillima]